MANVAKKKAKLKERIDEMEVTLVLALQKKTSNVKEINVPEHTRKIGEMHKIYNSM